jgi:hypothetical protein
MAGVTRLISVSTNGGAANGTSRASVTSLLTDDAWPSSAPPEIWLLRAYQVQFTRNLKNPRWQAVTNAVQIIGTEGYLLDPAPNGSQSLDSKD